ncbi:MAG: folate-binding protein YgfZ [Marinobacterium sp.]
MNTHWVNRLKQPEFELEGNRLIKVPSAEHSTHYVPLTDYSIISVKGPDAHKFLQGQLTCDLSEVDRMGALPGAHCNIKGHMHSLYQVMRASDSGYWLRIRTDMAENALTLLKKYIVFSKAEAELEEDLIGIGLQGPNASEIGDRLSSAFGIAHLLVTERPGARRECWFETRLMPQVLELVEQSASPARRNDWELLEIDAGVPELAPVTSEAFIPQMTNLQALNGVSFTKGCYTGQEIVTRLQHRGQLKKPMYLAEVHCKDAPSPGDTLASEQKDNVGQVVRAAHIPGGYRLLAVIAKDQAENQPLHLGNPEGPLLQLLPLPYELDPALFQSKR